MPLWWLEGKCLFGNTRKEYSYLNGEEMITCEYDARGRMVSKTVADNSTTDVYTYTYYNDDVYGFGNGWHDAFGWQGPLRSLRREIQAHALSLSKTYPFTLQNISFHPAKEHVLKGKRGSFAAQKCILF